MAVASAKKQAADAEGAAVGGAVAALRARLHALLGPDSRARKQFMAWWDGYYLPEEPEPEDAPAESAPAKSEPAKSDDKATLEDRWSQGRIKISELIWSDGFSFPGGAEHVLKLVKPMGLNKEKTLLDLGCGLGGAARVIHKSLGAWVTGMEASKTLAEAGMAGSEKAGLAKKAAVEWYDPTTVILPARKFDAAFARMVFTPLKDKSRLLKQLNDTLKSSGQMMFLEFVLREPGITSPALEACIKGEDHPPHFVAMEEYTRVLVQLGLDLRVAEDLTAEFRGLVLDGWGRLAKSLKPNTLESDEAKGLTHELELWARRVAAFDSGDLRVARFYAIKKA